MKVLFLYIHTRTQNFIVWMNDDAYTENRLAKKKINKNKIK